ncbi:hypothetical protein [Streptomyces fradiae]|uniref:Uncharacterized protein n=1 Tax=Streptomyces fradiae ATCC 10745 = DSM 40063 TaxID=1319510 RepID=A0A1Y2NU23_STRFR|nr:hypothetical protein [Streptomyces fradiae]OSY51022.1 hypothetical protein BG846_03330 [Streptomyces fradiae ATCC 10745 = DSM 40063]
MSGAGERDGDGSPSVSDEEWERFLQESVAGAAGAPEEPSANAREAAARERHRPPQGRRPRPPARARRGTGRYVAGLAVAAALLAAALFPRQLLDWAGAAWQGGTRPAAEEAPRDAPRTGPDLRPTVADPFRGSPAAGWAGGTAGITVPEARATGWMDAGQVGQALLRSRDFMAAAGLDPRVLRGERPEKAVALLNPHQKDVREYLRAALSPAAPTPKTDPLLLFSRFRPDQARLAGDVVRTRGQLTYREGKRGAVEVTADVTFVYPVTPAAADAGADAEVVRTIVRRQVVLSWDDPAKVVTEPGTASLVSYALHVTNGGCSGPTGYFVPPFGTAGDGPADPADRIDPYDRGEPLDTGDGTSAADGGCATAVRS